MIRVVRTKGKLLRVEVAATILKIRIMEALLIKAIKKIKRF
jgi:hypothetical protein